MRLKIFKDLKQGEKFRFQHESCVRVVSQIGKTEIYCPEENQNTMGHSMSGGEEVFLKNDQLVIIYE